MKAALLGALRMVPAQVFGAVPQDIRPYAQEHGVQDLQQAIEFGFGNQSQRV